MSANCLSGAMHTSGQGLSSHSGQGARFLLVIVVLLTFWMETGQGQSFLDEPQEHSEGPIEVGAVTIELISEFTTLKPGSTQTVALRFEIAPHWHLYWHNPGDAGLPPTISWTLPDGFAAGELQFPTPEKILLPPLASYGYEGDLYLLADLVIPPSAIPGSSVTLSGLCKWLVCKEQCVPGQAKVSLTIPISDEVPKHDPRWLNPIQDSRFRQPITLTDWKGIAWVEDTKITLELMVPRSFSGSLDSLLFFPLQEGFVEPFPAQELTVSGSSVLLTLKRQMVDPSPPVEFSGIVYNPSGWRGVGSEEGLWIETDVRLQARQAQAVGSTEISSLWSALLFAFLGGLILNLMPCVLPVLSLKILSFVNQAGAKHGKIIRHGVMFTLGVLVSFWALAGTLLALKAGGEQIGWGFQLQSPVFLGLIALFMFLFGLNLLGVFEIGESMTSVGSVTAGKTGDGAAFVNGLIATVVATPCTAPFMGAAMGFTLSQPAPIALLVFTAVGLGMAAPYLLLSAFPQLLKYLPKPGRWMESLKQFMGFLLLATVIWLATVLIGVGGPLSIIWLLVAMLLCGVAAWVYGRWGTLVATAASRFTAAVTALLLVAAGAYLFLQNAESAGIGAPNVLPKGETGVAGLQWEPYTTATLEQYRQEGRAVFVDFTADWCLSCKFNEATALNTASVREAFDAGRIIAMKGDWTRRDDEITSALAQFGRNSVPLYVFYPPNHGEPMILPELLTEAIVLEFISAPQLSVRQ